MNRGTKRVHPSTDTETDRSEVEEAENQSGSDTDTNTDTEAPSDTDTEDNMSEEENMEESQEHNDFMDKIASNWDLILQNLKDSDLWQSQEKALNSMDQDINALKQENKTLKARLMQTEGRLTRAERKLEEANDRIIDLTARSMRNNVVIKNVEETRGENVEEKIRAVFQEKLNVPNPELIDIKRAHRVGKQSGGRTRNIIAKLSSKGKTTVMTHLKNLPKGDQIRIQDQFPPEVNARRNKLWPQFIQARQAGKEARFNVDKLVVEKKVIDPPRDKVRDINMNVASRSLTMETKHTPVVSVDRSHFQGHKVLIDAVDDVIPAIQALCRDQRVAGASNIMYAYRIGDDRRYISNFEDDGQWGAGNAIINVLDAKNCFNQLIVVTRWHGGRNIGAERFDKIKDLAEQAIYL
jgi:hypothetical protein